MRRGSGERRAVERPATILLVDDHPPNLTALEAILQPLGGRLVCASSGAEAVAIAAEEDLALVLLDLEMPELDGLETAARLKEIERSRGVPIIILTTDAPTRAEVERGYASGAVDFLFKPFDHEALRAKVSVFIELHRRRSSREAVAPRAAESSGRVSERLVAAAPADQAGTVEALVRIYSALSEDLDVTNLAQRLASETMALTRASGAAFHYRPGTSAARLVLIGPLAVELDALRPSTTLLAPMFEAAPRGVRYDDARNASNKTLPHRIGAILGTPVVARSGELEGALVLVHDQPYGFDTRDEELVSLAAHYAARAFENARLYEESRVALERAEVAELNLRAGEARLRIAVDAAGLGTWDYNPSTHALRWDARCKALAGLAPDADVTYETFLASIHPEDRERVDAAVKCAIDPSLADDVNFDVEYRSIGIDDGAPRWLAARGHAIVENGRTVRFIGATLDITTKKRVEEERAELLSSEQRARAAAESASRSKDEFLATVSHELRNPLNAILGWARMLSEDDAIEPDRLRKGVDVILRNAKAQVQLVEDILEVSRIVTGKLRLSTKAIDVRMIAEAAIEAVRAAAQAKRVTLTSGIEASLGTIIADEDRVQQILWNLLSNAVKFTPTGGSVTVHAVRSDEAVDLVVVDTGEGIDSAFLPYVFDRFRQFDGSTTRRHGGLGLGLAIVRHLAELHGGTVRAESSGMGCGASFTVRLPIFPASDPAYEAPSPSRPSVERPSLDLGKPLCGRCILVLDDDPDMRELIGMILEDAGAVAVCVSTVSAAMTSLHGETFDVAVSDLAMPGEDGFAFARRVRSSVDERTRRVPLVAMTAYARAEDRRRVLEGGFDRHVAKPIEPEELTKALLGLIVDTAAAANQA